MENFRDFIENLANENQNIVLKINNQNWNDIFDYMDDLKISSIYEIDVDEIEQIFKNINIPTIIEKDDILDFIDDYNLGGANKDDYSNIDLIGDYINSIYTYLLRSEIKANCIRLNFRMNEKEAYYFIVLKFKDEKKVSERQIKKLYKNLSDDNTFVKMERKKDILFIQIQA